MCDAKSSISDAESLLGASHAARPHATLTTSRIVTWPPFSDVKVANRTNRDSEMSSRRRFTTPAAAGFLLLDCSPYREGCVCADLRREEQGAHPRGANDDWLHPH